MQRSPASGQALLRAVARRTSASLKRQHRRRAFRHFQDAGLIDILTCGATHGYMPLLGTDEMRSRSGPHRRQDPHPPLRSSTPPASGFPNAATVPPGSGATPFSSPALDPNDPGSEAEIAPGFDRIGIEDRLLLSQASASSSSTLTSSKTPSPSTRSPYSSASHHPARGSAEPPTPPSDSR